MHRLQSAPQHLRRYHNASQVVTATHLPLLYVFVFQSRICCTILSPLAPKTGCDLTLNDVTRPPLTSEALT
jgi:hypothetical protein